MPWANSGPRAVGSARAYLSRIKGHLHAPAARESTPSRLSGGLELRKPVTKLVAATASAKLGPRGADYVEHDEPAFTRVFGGTFMDVTTLYLDLFDSHPDARGKDESFSKSISAWHKWMRAAGGKTTKAPRTRSPSPVRGE